MPLKPELAHDQGLLAMTLRRWKTMGVVFAAVVATGAVAVHVSPKSYESQAKLLVMRTDQRLGGLDVMTDTLPELSNLNTPLFTQVELLRVDPVFEAAIRRLDLKDDTGAPLSVAELARRVKVAPVAKTDLIAIAYTGPDPDEAQRVVQAVCDAYLEQSEQNRRAGVLDGLKLVDDQLANARKRLAKAEAGLLAFKRQSGSVALDTEITAAVGELTALNTEIRTRQIELARAGARVASLRGSLRMAPQDALDAAAVAQNPRIQALQRELSEAEASPVFTSGLGPRHPDMIAQQARLAQLRERLRAETRGQLGHAARSTGTLDDVRLGMLRDLTAAQVELDAGRSGLAAALARRKALSASIARYPGQEVAFTRLNREVTVAGQIYQQLLAKREEARLKLGIAPTSARVVEPAERPTAPVAPLKGPTGPVLVLAGLAAGLAAGALKDLLDRRARPEDLAGAIQALSIYATVPTLSWHERRHGELVVGTPQSAHYVESLRALALALAERRDGAGGAVFGLSSTAAREGKSVTLANLALAMAEAGHRVLLVDADMRRPRVASLFGFEGSTGLTEVLLDAGSPSSAVRHAGAIDVVTAGRAPLPGGLVRWRHRLEAALTVWRAQYDVVLVDLPPLLVFAEVAQVSRQLDGLLMLANLQHVSAEALVAGVQQLQAFKAPVIGLVAISQMIGTPKTGYYLVAGEGLIG